MEIIRTKRKSIAIVIKPDGRLIVRSPLKTSLSYIEDLVRRKQDWIDRNMKKILTSPRKQIKPKQFVDGEEFLFLGEKFFLKVGEYKEISLLRGSTIAFPEKYLKNPRKKMLEFYYKKALEVLTELCQDCCQETGWKYTDIKIINAKTKWGSCNHKNELRFNWKLVMAPIHVIDYVVVHELAHIPEKNHSQKFWDKVERFCPDYKESKRWLKDSGYMLSI